MDYFVTQADAEKRLGFRMQALSSISAEGMLAEASYKFEGEGISETKERVYNRIAEYLDVENYPTEADDNFKEANINALLVVSLHWNTGFSRVP